MEADIEIDRRNELAETRRRLKEINGRIDALHEQERRISYQIGTRVAWSKPVGQLRKRRWATRDELEDLYAALPILQARERTLSRQLQEVPA